MKNIWTEKELECGMFIIRNDAGKIPFKDADFARTVVFKIGFSMGSDKKYGKISILTDGAYFGLRPTLKELADYLNEDERGYRPLTREELINLLKSSDQGFYYKDKGHV